MSPIIYSPKKLKPRAAFDFYETEPDFCVAAMGAMRDMGIPEPKKILDPGCGTGVWGWAAKQVWPKALVHGVELQAQSSFNRKNDGNQYQWGRYSKVHWGQDYLTFNPKVRFDLVIGNPPYRLAEEFVRKSFRLVNPVTGYIVFLLRLAFLEGQKRADDLWRVIPPARVFVLPRRPSFGGYNGKTDATAYGLFVWDGGTEMFRRDNPTFTTLWLNWERSK